MFFNWFIFWERTFVTVNWKLSQAEKWDNPLWICGDWPKVWQFRQPEPTWDFEAFKGVRRKPNFPVNFNQLKFEFTGQVAVTKFSRLLDPTRVIENKKVGKICLKGKKTGSIMWHMHTLEWKNRSIILQYFAEKLKTLCYCSTVSRVAFQRLIENEIR